MKKKEQQQQVKKFFDDISADYSAKYSTTHPFLSYFFQQRLSEATTPFSFEKKSILDIGAGPAPLFYFLQKKTIDLQYFATDLAPNMLEVSGLDANQYFVGTISEFPFLKKKYDYIYLLGVTTYFGKKELDQHLDFIQNHLSINGVAILSFTNRNSIDFKIRQIVRFLTRLLGFKKNVMGQDFNISAYSYNEVSQIIDPHFSIMKQSFLNQTFPPFSRLFPKTSISFAHFIKKKITSPTLLSWLSSDFLVFIKSKNTSTPL